MARFFKFIFRLLLLAYAAVILALVVPPLLGYTTAVVQSSTKGNQAVGTVDYARRILLDELNEGDTILVTAADSINVYTVQAVDRENSTVTTAESGEQGIPVRSYVYRMILTVPVIGYVIVALETEQGVIVLALTAVLLVLLCVLTGMWAKKAKAEKLRRKEENSRSSEDKKASKDSEEDSDEALKAKKARAEAYFAAQMKESRKPVAFEEYEDFPPKDESLVPQAQEALQTASESEYFDEDEDDGEVDFWLHDDVDDEELYAGMNSRAATESLMATARMFAINRAAQLKEQMEAEDRAAAAEEKEKTRIVVPETLAALKEQENLKPEPETEPEVPAEKQPAAPVKNFEFDKVINLKELSQENQDIQQIVLTINIKVVPE